MFNALLRTVTSASGLKHKWLFTIRSKYLSPALQFKALTSYDLYFGDDKQREETLGNLPPKEIIPICVCFLKWTAQRRGNKQYPNYEVFDQVSGQKHEFLFFHA